MTRYKIEHVTSSAGPFTMAIYEDERWVGDLRYIEGVKERAAFICRACNTHEELCHALSTAIRTIKHDYPTLAKGMAEILVKAKEKETAA